MGGILHIHRHVYTLEYFEKKNGLLCTLGIENAHGIMFPPNCELGGSRYLPGEFVSIQEPRVVR